MANTYYAVYEHITFSTKHRVRCLRGPVCDELFRYLAGAIRKQGCQALSVGGFDNHVHLLARKRSTLLTPDLVKEIKRSSSAWLSRKGLQYGKFRWQEGYGAFSVSYWDLNKIKTYIENQEQHHRRMSWEVEYRKLLIKHGVEFDEEHYLD